MPEEVVTGEIVRDMVFVRTEDIFKCTVCQHETRIDSNSLEDFRVLLKECSHCKAEIEGVRI